MATRSRRPVLLALLVAAALLAVAVLVGRRDAAVPPHGPPPSPASAPRAGAAPEPFAPVPSGLPITPPAPLAPADALPASFEGRVVSRATGEGIRGADLTFARGGGAVSVQAAADGTFRFEPPEEGRWLLAAVTAPGFLPFAPEWGHSPVELDARAGLHVRGLAVHLVPAVEILGRVVDREGAPVGGAEVRLLGAAGEAALVAIADRFTAEEDGTFRFSAPQGAVVEARSPGRAPGRAEVDLVATLEQRLTVRVGPPRADPGAPERIAGRVVAREGGAPVPGALVVAERERAFGIGALPVAQAVAGADGAFELAGVARGRYRVTARAEGRAPGTARRVVAGSLDVVLELDAGARLRGCVRDAATGAAVAPFTVLVFQRRSALVRTPQRSRSFVDASGCYALDDLAPGTAAVVVSAPGYAPSAEVGVEVPSSGEAVADLALERGGRLTGTVVDAVTRAPLARARLSVEGALADAASTFPVLASATTDASGRFVLEGLPRRFSLSVAAVGHDGRVVAGLDAPPGGDGGNVEIALRPVAPGEEPKVELAGIGVGVAVRGDALVVTAVAPRGGAADAGLAPGDVVVRVEGVPVVELGFQGAVDAIRGPEGTSVLLTVRRGETTFDVRAPRRLVRG
jgi:hypothetical protein